MKLREVLEQLSYGELRQMALGGSNASGIKPDDWPRVFPQVSLALKEIYKRFPIKTRQMTIQQYEHISVYHLDPKYAQTNQESTASPKYIMDTIYDPFTNKDEVLKIEEVFNEDGLPYYLNDDNQVYSLWTPTHNSIQVPYPDPDNAMTVQYRTSHEPITIYEDDEQTLDQEIHITDTYLEALLLYIAYRYFSTSGNAESVAQGNNFKASFELSCLNIERLNLGIRNNATNVKLEMNGWK
jgi:hypothetical protein